jgi:fused signal recognition particle receptor
LNDLVGKEIRRGKENEMILESFKNSLMDILTVPDISLKELAKEKKPVVIMFLGFNGSGKTTSIAKVANWLKKNDYTCVLAAADTFRAASLEQLQEHADKIGVKMIKHKYGADPAAVVYDAVEHAKSKKIDFVLADTAGRVHTNDDLMKEMEKIVRVNNPDIKVLVIDSLTGNDAIHQARSFGQFGVDATIFTKVDVNEKGGAILSVTNELKKPILFLGLGQSYDDFERFEPQKFIDRVLE